MAGPQYNLPEIVGQWIGDVRGNAVGTAYVETTIRNESLAFDIHINSAGNITVLSGELADDNGPVVRLTVTSPAQQQGEGTATGALRLDQVTPDKMTGRWYLANGAAGVIMLTRVDTSGRSAADQPRQPVELVAKETTLPSVTLYRRDLETIISRLGALLPPPALVVVTADVDGRNVVQFANDFLKRADLPRALDHIKLNISDNGRPFAKSIFVALSAKEDSKIIVQSDSGTWTNGVHIDVAELVSRYVSRVRAIFQRYGLNLNGIIFLAAIITVPDLPLISRVPFIAIVIVMIIFFARLHRMITRTTIYLDSTERGTWAKEVPSVTLGLVASAATWAVVKLSEYMSSESFATLLQRLIGGGL